MRDAKTANIHIHYGQTVRPYHRVVARLVARYCDGEVRVLDIGSGTGHTLSHIKELLPDAKLSAVDVDEKCLAITTEKVPLDEKILVQRLEELFKRQNYYHVVIMSHVLEHMLRPVDTVKGIMSIVKPGGIVVLAVPNPVRPRVFLSALARQHYVNRGHVCAWDRSHWINFLENILRLEVVCYSEDFIELPLLRKFRIFERLEVWLARLFPWLAFSNIAVIRKKGGLGVQ